MFNNIYIIFRYFKSYYVINYLILIQNSKCWLIIKMLLIDLHKKE
jgi:hypothetical protein